MRTLLIAPSSRQGRVELPLLLRYFEKTRQTLMPAVRLTALSLAMDPCWPMQLRRL